MARQNRCGCSYTCVGLCACNCDSVAAGVTLCSPRSDLLNALRSHSQNRPARVRHVRHGSCRFKLLLSLFSPCILGLWSRFSGVIKVLYGYG